MVLNESYIKFIEETLDAISSFPDLYLVSREHSPPYIEGDIALFDQNAMVYDYYSIKIECSNDYPNSFPLVYETAGRLPHNIDWHVYNDGHFCLCTPPEENIYCAKGVSLAEFVQDYVIPYLHNQSFREREGYFVNERSHGIIGIMEYFVQKTRARNKQELLYLLKFIIENDEPNRSAKCFCGSEKKYRSCHREAYRDFHLLGGKLKEYLSRFIRINFL